MIHGDADKVVPIQQSLTMAEALKKAGIETKLVVKEGAGHGWLNMFGDINQIVDWFDTHLKKPAPLNDAKRP
jgi:dipeptidyl aminopeptidase/acylaminoacyl peptidase